MKTIANIAQRFTEAYDRPARLYPGLLAISPFGILAVCLFGQEKPLLWSAASLIASCGGAFVLGRIVRDAGKRLQETLFQKWGGAPTTQLLRHANDGFDIHTKERVHKVLSKGIGKKMPTPAVEVADPLAADALYRAGAVWLIGQTRDTKTFPLVLKENIAFGFHRNAVGIRPWGISAALLCLAWSCIRLWPDLPKPPLPILISGAYSFSILLVWLLFLNEAALKRTGFAYAERLLQSLDQIKSSASVATRRVPKTGT